MAQLKLFGRLDSPELYRVRDFLSRCVVNFDGIDLQTNKTAETKYPDLLNLPEGQFAVEFPGEHLVLNPSLEDIAKQLGLINKPSVAEYDLSIFGAGPAGLSAAVYAASEGLKTILVEKAAIGGQAGSSSLIENYMGFPEGIPGAMLAEHARQQALKFGVEIMLLREGIQGGFADDRIVVELATGEKIISKANICATGVEYEHLDLINEDYFINKGLYYGAGATEASFCTGKDVFIVGGGNSAGQAASYFSLFARKVYMVIRKGNLSDTLSDYLLKRVLNNPKIEILYNSEVKELKGDPCLEGIKILNSQSGDYKWYETSKLFVCIGGNPNTQWAKGTRIIRDKNGYIITGCDLLGLNEFSEYWKENRHPFSLETSAPGTFAVGDVRLNSVKRVASAVGEGAMAIAQVHQFLQRL